MAGRSSNSTKGNADASLPSLASIMQEQAVEDKHEKMASHVGDKAPAKFSAHWKPLTGGTDASPMSKVMNEQSATSGPSRSNYKFKPTNRANERQTPYFKQEKVLTSNAHASLVTSSISSMTKTSVVNVRKQSLNSLGYKDLVDWLKDPSHVYIGRNMTHYVPGAVGSQWGNPFKAGKGGSRKTSTEMYRQYILTDTKRHANGKTLRNSLDELKGKTLGCWCHPELCHGHILVQLIEEHCE